MKEVILGFLQVRKEKKIKDKVKTDLSEDKKQEILQELEAEFFPKNWIENAAKRALQLTIASHPSKFSHPDSKTSSIIAKNQKENDGYLRSGNVECELDVFGNAAALDVYKFLALKTQNNKTILECLEQDGPEIKEIFCQFGLDYQKIRDGFLLIKEKSKSIKTDGLVKQVYFPVEGGYHLLSILTPSGILAKSKEKLDKIFKNFKKVKELRRDNKFYEGEKYDDLFDLTQMKYGGTKPQNISDINSKNGGIAYLLPSFPPKFQNVHALHHPLVLG
jgi:CRISPR-associated protein Csy1